MSFIEEFYDSAVGRVAAYAFAAATALSATGCAGGPGMVGRVVSQNVTGAQRDLHTAVRQGVMGTVRLTPCTNPNPAPRVDPNDRNASFADKVAGIFQRETTVNTTGVAVGDPAQCNNNASPNGDGVQRRQPAPR